MGASASQPSLGRRRTFSNEIELTLADDMASYPLRQYNSFQPSSSYLLESSNDSGHLVGGTGSSAADSTSRSPTHYSGNSSFANTLARAEIDRTTLRGALADLSDSPSPAVFAADLRRNSTGNTVSARSDNTAHVGLGREAATPESPFGGSDSAVDRFKRSPGSDIGHLRRRAHLAASVQRDTAQHDPPSRLQSPAEAAEAICSTSESPHGPTMSEASAAADPPVSSPSLEEPLSQPAALASRGVEPPQSECQRSSQHDLTTSGAGSLPAESQAAEPGSKGDLLQLHEAQGLSVARCNNLPTAATKPPQAAQPPDHHQAAPAAQHPSEQQAAAADRHSAHGTDSCAEPDAADVPGTPPRSDFRASLKPASMQQASCLDGATSTWPVRPRPQAQRALSTPGIPDMRSESARHEGLPTNHLADQAQIATQQPNSPALGIEDVTFGSLKGHRTSATEVAFYIDLIQAWLLVDLPGRDAAAPVQGEHLVEACSDGILLR